MRYITVIQTNVSLKSSQEGTFISFFFFALSGLICLMFLGEKGGTFPFEFGLSGLGLARKNQWISRLFCQICACATRFLFRKVCSQLPGQSDVRTRVKLHSVNTIVEYLCLLHSNICREIFMKIYYLLDNCQQETVKPPQNDPRLPVRCRCLGSSPFPKNQ